MGAGAATGRRRGKASIQSLGLKLNPRGNVAASTDDYKTSPDKVFVAGDMRRGQSPADLPLISADSGS
jgi:NADPH-dependent glutamate synthase beta subunit-like oxidoreductase